MANKTDQEIFKKMPWKDAIHEHSHSGVAMFKHKNHFVLAPLKRNIIGISYCLSRAMRIGQEKIESSEWKNFNIKYNNNSNKKWPHVILMGNTDV